MNGVPRKRKTKQDVLNKVDKNKTTRNSQIKTLLNNERENIPDEDIPGKQEQLNSYIDYCKDLSGAYQVKHNEVKWYTSIISDIKKMLIH